MDDAQITPEERDCLRRWFRQAIAEVEKREVTDMLLTRNGIEVKAETPTSHRTAATRQRTRRNGLKSHAMKKLLSV